ncbi:MAG TPA: anti-sigma factor [Pyrinomonadaceae bacterium]|nr:anti-sigma factor [Pyrinomonadaceae bacterium]
MSRRLLSVLGGIILSFATVNAVLAQDTQPTTTTPTTTTTVTTTETKAVQNADGSWTVVEYPVDKEVTVNLTPLNIANATGRAVIHRMADGTMVKLDLAGLPTTVSALNLYAVDPMNHVTLLGPVTVANGVATLSTKTPLDKFMLVLSPEGNLKTITPETPVVFRSAVPEGFAIVPLASTDKEGAAVGEKVAAVSTPGTTTAYGAPLLNVPGMKQGEDSMIKVNFTGALTGSRANIKIEPRKDGPTMITARFHELKEAPAGQTYVLWAVSPDNKFTKLGQFVNTGGRNEAEIKSETALQDFGLFVTLEDPAATSPHGTIVGTFMR